MTKYPLCTIYDHLIQRTSFKLQKIYFRNCLDSNDGLEILVVVLASVWLAGMAGAGNDW